MNIQRILASSQGVEVIESTPTGQYRCEASVTDEGELLLTFVEWITDAPPRPAGMVVALRFDRYETVKIRSALGKAGI